LTNMQRQIFGDAVADDDARQGGQERRRHAISAFTVLIVAAV
jgi:hypothetical protein